MKHRRRMILGIAVTMALSTLAWRVLQPREPVHQGKPFSFWLDHCSRTFDSGQWVSSSAGSARLGASMARGWTFASEDDKLSQQAVRVILQVGTNALPCLLKLAAVQDSAAKRFVLNHTKVLIKPISLLGLGPAFGRWVDKSAAAHRKSIVGFTVLGRSAKPAVPDLVHLLRTSPDPETRRTAAECLGGIGSAAQSAGPALMDGISDPDGTVRAACGRALADVHQF